MTTVAIDPGLSGGLAYKRDGQPAQAVAMPATEGDLVNVLRDIAEEADEVVAIVEEVGGYIGKAQPGSSAFKFGRNFGFILGVLQTLGVRVELVRPQKWQKTLSLGSASGCASKTEWKNKLKAVAQRLYPHLKLTLATADALLILDYALGTAPAASPRQEVRVDECGFPWSASWSASRSRWHPRIGSGSRPLATGLALAHAMLQTAHQHRRRIFDPAHFRCVVTIQKPT